MTRIRVGGASALVAAAWSALTAVAFYLFVHGSTGDDRNGSFLGFEGLAVGRAGVVTGAALVLLVWGLYPVVRARPATRRAAVTAGVGAAAFLVGRVTQTWLANPQDPEDFAGLRVTLGFYLESLGTLLLGVGFLVVAASSAALVGQTTSVGFLLVAVGSWLPLLSPALIPDHAGAVLGWDLAATLLALPLWVGLGILGATLLRTASSGPADGGSHHAARSAGVTGR